MFPLFVREILFKTLILLGFTSLKTTDEDKIISVSKQTYTNL